MNEIKTMNKELNKYRRNLFLLIHSNSFYPFESCKVIGNKYKGPCKIIIIKKYRFRDDDCDPSKVIIIWNGNHNWIMKIKMLHNGVFCKKRILVNDCNSIFEIEQILLNQIHLIESQIYYKKSENLLTDDFPF